MGKKIIITTLFSFGFFVLWGSASANILSSEMIASTQIAPTSVTRATPILRRGIRGSDVEELQNMLRVIPEIYPNGLVTGYFGSQTELAVKRFQSKEGIVTSGNSDTTGYGQVGPQTFLSLHASALVHSCPNEKVSSHQICLENYYEHFGETYGVPRALALLDAQIKYDPLFAGTCHAVMHRIAHVAVHEYGTLGEAFLHGNAECQNGYYHGAVEEFLRNDDPDTLFASDIRNFCSNTTRAASSSVTELNCVHGIGHALVYMTHDDLPRALVRCGDFLDDHLRAQCATGAFMEHSFVRSSDAITVQTLKSDPAFQCVQTARDQDECWITLTGVTIAKGENGTSTANQFCQALSPLYRTKCTDAVKNTSY